jgi:hypothetical protein
MNIQVLPLERVDGDGTGEYLAVHTHHDPKDDTVTLATIQLVVERTVRRRASDTNWHVKNLIVDHPMSLDAALGFATCYAEHKNVPVIYTNED